MRLRAAHPCLDPLSPPGQRGIVVTTGIELLVAVQAQVEKAGRNIFDKRPLARCVGQNDCDTVASQLSNELRYGKAFMTYLHCVAQPAIGGVSSGYMTYNAVMVTCQQCGMVHVPWQLFEECLEQVGVVTKIGRKLPQHGSQFLPQFEHARRKEIRQWPLDIVQALHMGDIAWRLDREHELARRCITPLLVTFRALQ